jgi:hypothetical protein
MGVNRKSWPMTPHEIAAELDAIADLIESVWQQDGNQQRALEEVEARVIGLARRIRSKTLEGRSALRPLNP